MSSMGYKTSLSFLKGTEVTLVDRARMIHVDAPLDVIPLHVRGGYILPIQEPANTTKYRSVFIKNIKSSKELYRAKNNDNGDRIVVRNFEYSWSHHFKL